MILFLLLTMLATQNTPLWRWVYASGYDYMREQRSDVAGVEATNQAILGAPYRGVTRATLLVRRVQAREFVSVAVENAVGDCDNCRVLVRIDKEPSRYWSGNSTPDDTGFDLSLDAPVDGEGHREFDALQEIHRARDIQVEVPFYVKGRYQYQFRSTVPLRWPEK
jgi:hypothetical protein